MPTKSTNKVSQIQQLVDECLEILGALGIPVKDLTLRRQTKMAKAVLALADIRVGVSWQDTKDNHHDHRLLSRQIIAYMNAHLGEQIADSSYDDIRREDLVLPVLANIVLKSAKNPNANKRRYERLCNQSRGRKGHAQFWDKYLGKTSKDILKQSAITVRTAPANAGLSANPRLAAKRSKFEALIWCSQ